MQPPIGAVSQSRFRAFGRMIEPGDRIPPEEMAKVTPEVRGAWVSQKLVVLDGSSAPDGQLQARVDALSEKVDGLSDRLDALLEALGQPTKPRATAKPKA